MTVFCVAGLGRCGSSMTMQMLHAGGMPCAGSYPDFEDDRVSPMGGGIDPDWFASLRGSAVKWLNPTDAPAPSWVPKAVLWLTRDAREQARSQIKFLNQIITSVPNNRDTVNKFAATIRTDERRCLGSFYGKPHAVIGFEDILANPSMAAKRIAAWVKDSGGPPLNEARMAAVVLKRSPRCRRDLAIEERLAEQVA